MRLGDSGTGGHTELDERCMLRGGSHHGNGVSQGTRVSYTLMGWLEGLTTCTEGGEGGCLCANVCEPKAARPEDVARVETSCYRRGEQ